MLAAAGILNIISGAVQLFVAIGALRQLYSDTGFTEYEHSPEYTPEGYLFRFFVPFLICGLLAITGGINSISRPGRMGFIWTGSITASFPILISWSFLSDMFALVFGSEVWVLTGLLGIVSLILIGLYRKRFIQEEERPFTIANHRILGRIPKRWMPIAAGAPDIIIGVVLALSGLRFLIAGIFAETRLPMHGLVMVLIFMAMAFLAWLAITGGMSNLKRTRWRLAMAGSITTTVILCISAYYLRSTSLLGIIPAWLLIFLLGIAVSLLTFQSRSEFEQEEFRHARKRKWKSKTAGILDVICGLYSIIIVYYAVILHSVFERVIVERHGHLYLYYTWIAGLVIIFIAGVLAITGGTYALKSKGWRMALIGGIAASIALILLAIPLSLSSIFLTRTLHLLYDMAHPAGAVILVLLGIAVTVLTVLSKKDFK